MMDFMEFIRDTTRFLRDAQYLERDRGTCCYATFRVFFLGENEILEINQEILSDLALTW